MAERALIVSGGEKGAAQICEALCENLPLRAERAADAAKARERLKSAGEEICLIVIVAPLPDGDAKEFAEELARETLLAVLYVADEGGAEELDGAGVPVLTRPLSRQALLQGARHALAARRRLLSLAGENTRLRGKLDETKLVGRAKAVLIQVLSMTEPQAHRYIEKQAMDLRVSRTEVAGAILRNYDL